MILILLIRNHLPRTQISRSTQGQLALKQSYVKLLIENLQNFILSHVLVPIDNLLRFCEHGIPMDAFFLALKTS